ncbi:hypothetical protein [Yonghaparkia sp. Root332]|uniref:hypothetical protein n=1 Tax=Yonghaparkia sp. Root332 TaxID=1736516 RepID=UPI0012E3E901|nr:hypothetical protein [Yonghaparkia sp. Root332]
MTDHNDPAVQELMRVFKDIDSVCRSMRGWEVPEGVKREFLKSAFEAQFDENGQFSRDRGTAGSLEPFIHNQAFAEFFDRLQQKTEFENTALFMYRHNYSGPREMGSIDSLADLENSPFGLAYNVTPTDTVIVPVSFFGGDLRELLRILDAICQRMCLLYIQQDDFRTRVPFDELTEWFADDERLYVPVLPDLIPGFYRMSMPIGPDSWG